MAARDAGGTRRSPEAGQLLVQAWVRVNVQDLTNAALYLNEAALLARQVGDRSQLAESIAVGAVLLDALGMPEAAAMAAAAAQYWWPGGDGEHTSVLREVLGTLRNVRPSPETIINPTPATC